MRRLDDLADAVERVARRADALGQNNDYLYHGTSSTHLDNIKKNGLLDPYATDPNRQSVMFHTNQNASQDYAKAAAHPKIHGGSPVLLRTHRSHVRVNKEYHAPDEGGSAINARGPVKPEHLEIHHAGSWKKLVNLSARKDSEFSTGFGEKAEVGHGTTVYHATHGKPFGKIHNKTTWFTPFKGEAEGFRRNFMREGLPKARIVSGRFTGHKIAEPRESQALADKVWPGEKLSYSMFDPNVGEYDPKEVKKFTDLHKAAGYHGAKIHDYSGRDYQKDAHSLAIFEPHKHFEQAGEYKAE